MHRNIERFVTGGDLAAADIEDMMAKHRAAGVCSYHVTRDLQLEGANVLLLTYGQLFDAYIRRCNGTDALLAGALVLLDEGHNVPGECRKAASANVDARALFGMGKEAKRMEDVLLPPLLQRTAPYAYRNHVAAVAVLGRLVDSLLNQLHREVRVQEHGWVADGQMEAAHLDGAAARKLITGALEESSACRRTVSVICYTHCGRHGDDAAAAAP